MLRCERSRFRSGLLLAVVAALLAPAALAPLSAVEVTSDLKGFVLDKREGPLENVRISLTGARLMGERNTTSDARGAFEFRGVPPGTYLLKLSTPGYLPLEREAVVNVGWSTTLTIEMAQGDLPPKEGVRAAEPPPEAAPAAKVEKPGAEGPLEAGPPRTNTEDDYTRDYLDGTPIGSGARDYLSLLQNSPGIGPGSGGNPTVRGSTIGENVYRLDGVDTTDPYTGTFGSNLIFDAIDAVRFQTGGFEAEYGRSTGGLVDVTTKSGGNDFQGSVDLRYRNQDFIEKGNHLDPSAFTQENEIAQATLGGPIVKDKLWFFLAGSFTSADFQSPGSPTQRRFQGRYYLGKLTWQISSRQKLVLEGAGDPTHIDNEDASSLVAAAATSKLNQGSQLGSLRYQATLTSNLLLQAQVAHYRSDVDVTPQNGDLTTIGQVNLSTGALTANAIDVQRSDRLREEANASLTWHLPRAAGDHTFKFGADVQGVKFGFSEFAPGGEYDVLVPDPNGTLVTGFRDRVTSAGKVNNRGTVGGYFAQDEWRVDPRWTIDAGVRLDAFAYDDNTGRKVFDASLVEPRVGVAWDATGDGVNVLKAYGGVYADPSLLALPQAVNTRANLTTILNVIDPNVLPVVVGGPGSTVFADGGRLKATNILESSLGYARRLGKRSTLDLTLVKRLTRDIIEDRFDAASNLFVIDNLPGLTRRDSGAEVRYTAAWKNVHLWASYAYGVSRGNIEYTQGLGTDFDFPILSTNRFGYLSDDARHTVRLNGWWDLPLRFQIGYAYVFRTGLPENLERTALPYGEEFIRPRGYLRMPTFQQLDLEGRKIIPLGKTRLEVIATILNVANSEIVTATDNFDVSHHALAFQAPRRYEAGLRYLF